jgi:hypothetical protein
MNLDTWFVLGVLVLVALLHPDTENKLHRIALTMRFWRNGYNLRRAWRLSGDH